MRIHRLFLSLLFVFGSVNLSQGQIKIVHLQPAIGRVNRPIPIEVRLENDGTMTDQVRVYYKSIKNASYKYIELQPAGQGYRGEIPPQPLSAEKVQYFIMVIPRIGGPVTYPEVNPFYEPLEIQIIPKETIHEEMPKKRPPVQKGEKKSSEKGVQPRRNAILPELDQSDYVILTPDPGSSIRAEDAFISVSILADSGIVDPSKTVVLLDGRKLQFKASEYLVTAVPPEITPGRHLIAVVFHDPKGRQFRPIRWRFTVEGPGKRGALSLRQSVRGNVFLSTRQERVSGRSLADNRIGGNLSLRKEAFQLGTRFNITSQEDRNFQARNRFLFWMRMPWVKFQFGDTSPAFTELILSGKRVRGVNAQVDLGIFHLNVAAGQTNRGIEGNAYIKILDPLTGDSLYINPVTGDTLTSKFIGENQVARYGTYAQNLWGLHLAVGKPAGFLWGLSLLKVKDNVHSIRRGIRPKDNLVLGTDLSLAVDRGRFRWQSEAAFSVLSEDISNGAISKTEIDSTFDTDLPFDPKKLEKWIILNASTIPIDPRRMTSLAAFSRVQLNYWRNFVHVEYKSIGSAYNSLGNSYLRRNLRGLFLSDRIRLFRNRVYLTLGYEDYFDNFRQLNKNPKIHIRSLRSGLNYYPGRRFPSLNLSVKRYGRNNQISTLDLTPGSVFDNREDNTTNEITFNASYKFKALNLEHRLNYNLIQMTKTDAFAASRPLSYFPIGITNRIHYFTFETNYHRPLKSIIRFATNRNSYQGGLSRYNFNTIEIRLEAAPQILSLFGYGGVRLYRANGLTRNLSGNALAKINFQKYQFELGGRIEPWKNHFFSLDSNWILFQDRGERYNLQTGGVLKNKSYQNYLFMFRYDYRF